MTTQDQKIIEQYGGFVQKFKILHHGWDMDGYGYVIPVIKEYHNEKGQYKTEQRYKLVLTNHSKPYEASVSELRQKVIEYQQAIGETNSVIELLDRISKQ
jgi:hypothetical protein